MRPALGPPALVLLTSIVSTGTALQAIDTSPCAVSCGNVLGNTTGDDIACQDSDFGSVLTANTFQSCITCQLGSTYIDPKTKQTDLQWGLYNLRYAISWCLFGFPNNTAVGDTPCITSTACGSLETAIEFDGLSPNTTSYGYCGLFHNTRLNGCSDCLGHGNQFFLKNYFTALIAACQQQPIAGSTISLDGSLFSKTAANITSPSAAPVGSIDLNQSGLTLGAKVGIAVGALIFILIVTGYCVVWNGKRRRRRALRQRQRESGVDSWKGSQMFHGAHGVITQQPLDNGTPQMSNHESHQGAFFDSPQSQRPLHPTWMGRSEDESPASAMGEKTYFSPYSSNYTSPVSASDQVHVVGREWPTDRKEGTGGNSQQWPIDRKGSLGGSDSGRFRGRSRSKERGDIQEPDGDQIEMQNVPPVLLHPGYGRGGGLTEEDLKRGNAL